MFMKPILRDLDCKFAGSEPSLPAINSIPDMHVEAPLEERAVVVAVLEGVEDVEGALLHARARVGALVERDLVRRLDDLLHAGRGDRVLAEVAAETKWKFGHMGLTVSLCFLYSTCSSRQVS